MLLATLAVAARLIRLDERVDLERLAGTPWTAVALVFLDFAAFALALPGGALLVASGLVFTPPVATALSVLGATAGSLAGYAIGSTLGADARERWERRPGFALVARNLDFPGLVTLQLLPLFPHALVSYGAGFYRARLGPFVAACVIGFGVKTWIYATVVRAAALSKEPLDRALLRPSVWGPLFALAGIALTTKLVASRRRSR